MFHFNFATLAAVIRTPGLNAASGEANQYEDSSQEQKGMTGESKIEMLDRLAQAHAEQDALCMALEEIADSLPDDVDRQRCVRTARALGTLMQRWHALEEEVVFPELERGARDPVIHRMIKHLKLDHCSDQYLAEEVQIALFELGEGEPNLSPDAVGYVLRGFFEGLRRHIAMERDVLWPALVQSNDNHNDSATEWRERWAIE